MPDAVKFHANKLLSGQWDPYPIDMAFQPPCMVREQQGGKVSQCGLLLRVLAWPPWLELVLGG